MCACVHVERVRELEEGRGKGEEWKNQQGKETRVRGYVCVCFASDCFSLQFVIVTATQKGTLYQYIANSTENHNNTDSNNNTLKFYPQQQQQQRRQQQPQAPAYVGLPLRPNDIVTDPLGQLVYQIPSGPFAKTESDSFTYFTRLTTDTRQTNPPTNYFLNFQFLTNETTATITTATATTANVQNPNEPGSGSGLSSAGMKCRQSSSVRDRGVTELESAK